MATDTFDPIRNGVTESVVFFVKFGMAPLLFAALFGVAALAFYLVLHYKLLPEHAKNDETKLSDLNATSKEEEEGLLYEIQTSTWSFGHRVVYYGLFVSSIILTISLWLVFMFLTAFDLIPVGAGIFLSFLTLFIFWTVFFARSNLFFPSKFHYKAKNDHYFKRIGLRLWSFLREVKHKIVQKPILFTIVVLFAFFVSFISCFFISGLCVCGDPDYTSTRYQRSKMDPPCKEGRPCHVYLTVPEHPTTEINVNFQTASKTQDVRVYYDIKSHINSSSITDYTFVQTGASFDMGSVLEITRYVHWVHLTGLEPNTTYYFIAGYGDSKDNYSIERKFKTIPTSGDIHFVSGGDMGVIPVAEEIAQVMAIKEPQFALLGGDISYANSMPQCWPRWDMWLSLWESIMVTPSGYTVPILMAIGNHEASYVLPVNKVPFFLNYFNQQSLSSIAYNAVPTERKTYHTHFIGKDTVIYVLDSGHSSSAAKGSPQTEWLQSELSRDVNVANRITVYHVPMYPSKRSFTYYRSQDLREAWSPLFDQGKVKLSFENHDHSYKRTKRLKNNVEDVNGTVYLGDGCLGVDARPRSDAGLRWYEEAYFPRNHFFDVYINGSYVHVEAVDHNATIFDTVNYDGYL